MTTRLQLKPIAPFRLDLTVWALRRRAHNEIDRWDSQTWRRALVSRGIAAELAVTQIGPTRSPKLEVEISGTSNRRALEVIEATVRAALGVDVDLGPFYRLAARDEHLAPVVERLRGMKPPRFPSLFEALANAIVCQQVSLTAGMYVLNRLAKSYGQASSNALHAFPEPNIFENADPQALRAIGFSHQKARSLIEVARASARRRAYSRDALEALDDEAALRRLCELRGIGRWSAEYAMLRGLGRLNVFPADDVGGQNKLKSWLEMRGKLNYENVKRRLSRWHPYQGLVYFHLLVNDLAQGGFVGDRAAASPVEEATARRAAR